MTGQGILDGSNTHCLLFLESEILTLALLSQVTAHWNDISVFAGSDCGEQMAAVFSYVVSDLEK